MTAIDNDTQQGYRVDLNVKSGNYPGMEAINTKMRRQTFPFFKVPNNAKENKDCYSLSINNQTGDCLCCKDVGSSDVLPTEKEI